MHQGEYLSLKVSAKSKSRTEIEDIRIKGEHLEYLEYFNMLTNNKCYVSEIGGEYVRWCNWVLAEYEKHKPTNSISLTKRKRI